MIKRFIFIFFFLNFLLLVYAQDQLHKRIQVKYSAEVQLTLSKLGLPVDYLVDDLAILEIPESECGRLTAEGISFQVLIDDVTNFYVDRNRGYDPGEILEQFRASKDYPVPAGFTLGSMGGFCTYDEMLQHLDNMAAMYPNLITQRQPIGTMLTVEGRPVYWLRISDNPTVNEAEPEILYTGLTHAREPGSMQLLLYYMYYLLENYSTDPEIKTLVDNTEMYFIPCVNPDGYIFNQTTYPNGGGQWRKNMRNNGSGYFGVDLNRNYGYMWGYDNIGSSPSITSLTYRGTAPFSEIETQLVRDFCIEHDFKIALNYHSFGNYLLHAWGYVSSPVTPDYAYFAAIGKEMTSQNNFRVGTAPSVLYLVNGEANDWMYGEQTTKSKIFCFTPEIGSSADGFWPSIPRIIPQCYESLQQNITAAKLAGPYYLINDIGAINISKNNGYCAFEVQRLGVADASCTITLQALSSQITSVGGSKTYNGMERLQKITDSISYTLKPGILPGEQIRFLLKIESGAFNKSYTITKIFGTAQVLFSDDCSTMNNWQSTKWNITGESYVSPAKSITDSPGAYYANSETSTITLINPVNLSGSVTAWLAFSARWELDGGDDYVFCEVSSDAGESWTPVQGKFSTIPAVVSLPAVPLYFGKQTTWVNEYINLTEYCGSSVLIRFTLKTDVSITKDGFYFDDLIIARIDGTPQSEQYAFGAGWSGLSSYLIPQNTNFNAIFADNQSKLAIVQDIEGNFYQPGNLQSTLSYWDTQKGYKIKFLQDSPLSILGFPETYKQLNLTTGWNLIPVISQSPILISALQVSPAGSIEVIKEIAGPSTWWPAMGITTLNSLIPGKSYFIKLKNNATLTFP